MLLTESTGIQTQQTSQVSGSASIRIQGLDGKYTQLLQDGFPLYSGFAGGLSILQIPPLNLRRAEIVKGSASTLYGGGAIAGLINLITKEPTEKRELSFLSNLNQTHALDLSGFYAEKYKNNIGITFLPLVTFRKLMM
jgi:iron complex outermembrane receptor protein